ncbi:MAG: single-stranded-DNA-specific exonuclease RecJ [Candidatus Falkowbacteria bacterium]|nr:single-stranded-DNA-specific exonuclease RecJ [Candidatus Falkowbacteria bacterium]
MAKKWQVLPAMPKDFLSEHTDLLAVVRQLLFNRGLKTKLEADHFLHTELHLKQYLPNSFRSMDEAIQLTISHIKARHKIAVCGDYDADGVSSSAIMTEVIRSLKGEVEVWIPSRFGQGYGLNKQIIEELKANGFSLIITVDNGIRSKAEVEYAQSIGLDVIITDHHEGPLDNNDLPNCLVIDPILKEETYPFKYLCGAGVAYKFASALINASTLAAEEKEKLDQKFLDLAAVGTVADCVSLLGENRLLVIEGLKIINRRPRLGLRELMNVCNIPVGDLTEWNLSWQLVPRLNVAGRLNHANTAYKLLITDSVEEAQQIARELNEKNIERQRMTELIVNEATKMIEQEQKDEFIVIAVAPDLSEAKESSAWNEGVIGLAAGRLCEKFGRPCMVITKSENQIKGSGRSIEQFNIVSPLEAAHEQLTRYGGHKMACGFSLKDEAALVKFIEIVRAQARTELKSVDLTPVLRIDAEMLLSEVNEDFIETIESFAPFGQDNPEPIFLSRARIEEIMVMGKEKTHIKFRLNGKWALAFSRAELFKDLKINDEIDVVYTVCFNIFNGRREAQLKIIDLKSI